MAIRVGDKCPLFTLPNQNGQPISISDFIGEKFLVIYFYPKDHSGGCTAEACAFRDSYELFEEMGCAVFGISSDSIASHEAFAAKHRLSFNLLSDTEKTVRKQFGVPSAFFGLVSGRVTYLVDKRGIVREIHNSMSNAEGHITKALSTVEGFLADEARGR